MKKLLTLIIATASIGMAADAKTLVVYYSRTGNTDMMAQEIASATGADTFRVETEDINWYPEDYNETTEQVKKEIADGTLPPVLKPIDVTPYDTVFVGSPCWWGTIATPLKTFLKGADFTDKTVIPFNTHEGSGICGHTDIVELTPGANYLNGLAIRGGLVPESGDTITEWLKEIKIIK